MTMTAADYDSIVVAVQFYVDGFNDHDIKKFQAAFHENASVFFTDQDGVLHNGPAEKFFKPWATEGKGDRVEFRILSVAQMGDAAGVSLVFGDDWLDFHTLVRVDGVWKITNKTATHRSR